MEERKAAEVAMITLMSRCPRMLEDPYLDLWPGLLSSVVSMLQVPVAQRDSGDVDDELAKFEMEEAGGYQASYTKLATVNKTKRDPVAEVSDPELFFAKEMATVAAKDGGKVGFLVLGRLYRNANSIARPPVHRRPLQNGSQGRRIYPNAHPGFRRTINHRSMV